MKVQILIATCLSIVNIVNGGANKDINFFNDTVCDNIPEFNEELRSRIDSLSIDISKIVDFVLKNQTGLTYEELAKFVDKFGSRLTGTDNLENAIEYMKNKFQEENIQVNSEPVSVPKWSRGKELVTMITPRQYNLSVLTLGGSVGTNGQLWTKDVVVVKDFDELKRRSAEVRGKIVVYNFNYTYYGEQIVYRLYGAVNAAKFGAVAALVKSVTPFSINSPHAGWMYWNSTDDKIPGVSITVEDAEMLGRITSRGENVRISLYLEANNYPNTTSHNTIGDIVGTDHPNQMVIISGHIDSWDVGQGAMDDGGGAFITWRAMSIIKQLGLRPKRTIRSILWTGEEFGLIGAHQYAKDHSDELDNISVAMEADYGTFSPRGLTYSGKNQTAHCVLSRVLKLMAATNATILNLIEEGSDTDVLMGLGVPGSMLENQDNNYFHFHHTSGDTMTVLDSHQLDLCTAFWAATAYAVASLDDLLPR